MRRRPASLLALLTALTVLLIPAADPRADPGFPTPWPRGAVLQGLDGEAVRFASISPFTLGDATDPETADPTEARGRLFLPPEASAAAPVPAVVLLHGAGGVLSSRELTYGRQFAAMGVAALVVDAFGARRDRATGFVDRLLQITEVMLVADAYAGLRYLDARPEVDTRRSALIGFSYGGMSSVFAAYRQVAETLAPDGPRFAGHVAFYAPCIARFTEPATTGAPLLMLSGAGDAIVDPDRCAEIADDLRRGGSAVETIVYPDAVHQWDGGFTGPRMIGRNLAPCSFRVDSDGVAWDRRSHLPMSGPLLRKVILGLCVGDEGYLIGRDDAVRARSNADLGRFLEGILE